VAKPPTILRPASGLDSFPDAHAYVWCLKIQHARRTGFEDIMESEARTVAFPCMESITSSGILRTVARGRRKSSWWCEPFMSQRQQVETAKLKTRPRIQVQSMSPQTFQCCLLNIESLKVPNSRGKRRHERIERALQGSVFIWTESTEERKKAKRW